MPSLVKCAGTCTFSASGAIVWDTPANDVPAVLAEAVVDGGSTIISCINTDTGQITKGLLLTNFGYAFPVGTIINGISARLYIANAVNEHIWQFNIARLRYLGAVIGENKAAVPIQVDADMNTPLDIGSAIDKWGITPEQEANLLNIVNDPTFGITLQLTVTSAVPEELWFDYLGLEVHYTPPPPALPASGPYIVPAYAPIAQPPMQPNTIRRYPNG